MIAVAAIVVSVLAVAGFSLRHRLDDAGSWLADRSAQAVATWKDWGTRLQRIAEDIPDLEVEARTAVGESVSTLVVVGAGTDDSAFALISRDSEGVSAVTLLPQTLLAVVPGYGEFTLVDALVFEGPDLVALTVVNLLGVRIDHVLALSAGTLAGALPETLVVDLPVGLFVPEDGGTVRLVDVGEQEVAAPIVATLLATRGVGDPFEWLQRQGAAWKSVLAAVAEDASLADRLAADQPRAVADLLIATAVADDLQFESLPVERTSTGDSDTFALSADAPVGFVPDRLGHLMLRVGERPRAEVLNGNGRIGTTIVVAETLVRRGFRVVRTDNADRFDYAETVVVAQGRANEEAAGEAAVAVGAGTLYLEVRAPSTAVDVSIIVGLDIPSGED
jgi:hypothetical protein